MIRFSKKIVCWLLVAMMVASPTWGYAQEPAAVAPTKKLDLSFVTPEAVAAVVLHPRRVLTAPEMAMLPIEIISAAGIQEFGIDPADIEQVIGIVEPPAAGPPGYGVVFRLAKPYRLDALKVPAELPLVEAELDGRPYRQSPNPMTPGLYMPDEKTLLVATDAVLKKMLTNQKEPTEGPLSRLMSQTDTSADVLVLAVVEPVRPMLTAGLGEVPLPVEGLDRVPGLIDAAKVEVVVTGGTSASLVLLSPDDAAAEELEGTLNRLLDMGQQATLAQVNSTVPESDDPIERAASQYSQRITRHMFDMLRPVRTGRKLRVDQGGVASQSATIGVLVALLLPAVEAAREAARRSQATNNLRQIAVAMHNRHDVFRKFPARANFDADGKPLLSWRVHLLPYLDQQALYDQFRLDEPWDSEHNKKLAERVPQVYRNPSSPSKPGHASFVVPTGKGTIFESKEGTPISKITDGTSNTILVLEVNPDSEVIWTKPDDFKHDPDQPLTGLGKAHPGGFNAAIADGGVRFISANVDPQTFLRLLMMNDGQPVELP